MGRCALHRDLLEFVGEVQRFKNTQDAKPGGRRGLRFEDLPHDEIES
jgi:hypothetical protein